MVNELIYCSNSLDCPFYENWRMIGNTRLDTIRQIEGKFSCIAIDAVYNKELNIPINNSLEERISKNKTECEKIKTLNLFSNYKK